MSIYKFSRWFAENIATQKRIIVISACILLIGLLLEGFNDQWAVSAFSRSGSLLVAFAILCVFVNHVLKDILGNRKKYVSAWDKSDEMIALHLTNSMPFDALQEAAKQKYDNVQIDQKVINESISNGVKKIKSDVADAKNDIEHLINTNKILSLTEMTAGVGGTLVWGFGDLLFKVFR